MQCSGDQPCASNLRVHCPSARSHLWASHRCHSGGAPAGLHGDRLEASSKEWRGRYPGLLPGLQDCQGRRHQSVAWTQHTGCDWHHIQSESWEPTLFRIGSDTCSLYCSTFHTHLIMCVCVCALLQNTYLVPLRRRTWRRMSFINSKFVPPTWPVLVVPLCPVRHLSAKNGPWPCQVTSLSPLRDHKHFQFT